ncbi:MAG: Flagellar biosynthesis protein, FliO [Firmicutes bacterium]|nr:Flagellar biosynthesis protein, FliO [Bacillota bacterium]
MKKNQYRPLVLVVLLLAILAVASTALAAEQAGNYLNYKEPEPAGASWLSTLSYMFTLLVMFGAVIAMAYGTSRFLGKKMGNVIANGNNKVCATVSLGQNRAVQVVEVAGRFLVLGVTDHNINLLQEITDPEQIEKLKTQEPVDRSAPFEQVFHKHLTSLQNMSERFPGVFGNYSRKDK